MYKVRTPDRLTDWAMQKVTNFSKCCNFQNVVIVVLSMSTWICLIYLASNSVNMQAYICNFCYLWMDLQKLIIFCKWMYYHIKDKRGERLVHDNKFLWLWGPHVNCIMFSLANYSWFPKYIHLRKISQLDVCRIFVVGNCTHVVVTNTCTNKQ